MKSRFHICMITLLVTAGCRGSGGGKCAFNIETNPARATSVAAGAELVLGVRSTGNWGRTAVEWSVANRAAPQCAGSVRDKASPATKYQAPGSCAGDVTLTLVATGDCAGSDSIPITILQPPGALASSGTPSDKIPDFPLDGHLMKFEDDERGMKAFFEEAGGALRVTLQKSKDRGFAGVCLERSVPLDASDMGPLELDVAVRDVAVKDGGDRRLEFKLERPVSGCDKCQCYLYEGAVDRIPKKGGTSRASLPTSRCDAQLLKQVKRVCVAANAANWPRAGSAVIEVANIRFHRAGAGP